MRVRPTSPVFPPAGATASAAALPQAPRVESPWSAADSAKIGLAQIEVIPGRPDLNFRKYLEYIEKAKRQGLEVVVFPEMSLTGYLLGDDWESESLVRDFVAFNEKVREASRDLTIIWGGVHAEFDRAGKPVEKGEDGRVRKYNAAFVARDGQWVGGLVSEGKTYKTLMPKYRMFDDERHFYSSLRIANERKTSLQELLKPFEVEINGRKRRLGIILCEDMWSDDYADSPIDVLLANGAEAMVDLSCSPWTWRKNDKRHRVVEEHMGKTQVVPFFYCNNIGIQNNGKNVFVFEGGTTIYDDAGRFSRAAAPYTEQILTASSRGADVLEARPVLSEEQDIRELFEAAIFGIRKFFEQCTPSRRVVNGLSGGIDSAVTTALYAIALGAENVYTVNMPSKYNSKNTKDDARLIAESLGVHYAVQSIQESVDRSVKEFGKVLYWRFDEKKWVVSRQGLSLSGLQIENIQARDRGSRILAAHAAEIGAIVSCNGNKTETAFGYATLYGDVLGGLCPIADLYKGQVYALARYINHYLGREVIPQSVIDRVPSAELSENQDVDKGQGDPFHYAYHDRLLYAWVELRKRPEDILEMYLSGDLTNYLQAPIAGLPSVRLEEVFRTPEDFVRDLENKWTLFKRNYFKRVQAPPILTFSKRSLGFDLREFLVQGGVYETEAFRALKATLLEGVKA